MEAKDGFQSVSLTVRGIYRWSIYIGIIYRAREFHSPPTIIHIRASLLNETQSSGVIMKCKLLIIVAIS